MSSKQARALEWQAGFDAGVEQAAPEWRDISTAPKDGTWIIARTGQIQEDRWAQFSRRCFVVRHLGRHARFGVDMGWVLFPGMVCGDEWLTHWAPLPAFSESPPMTNEPEMVGTASLLHRIACHLGWTQTFVQGSDDTGVWGECSVCGKRAGYVTREQLRSYAGAIFASHEWPERTPSTPDTLGENP